MGPPHVNSQNSKKKSTLGISLIKIIEVGFVTLKIEIGSICWNFLGSDQDWFNWLSRNDKF